MFEKKQTFPLLLYNAHWKKEKKILSCNEEIKSYCFVGGFVCALFCLCIKELRKWLKKDKRVNIQDKTGQPSWTRQNTAKYSYDIKEKSVLWSFSEEIVTQINYLQKRTCVTITHLIPPNKINPSKKCLTRQKSAHLYNTILLYLIFSQHIDTNLFYCPIFQCAAQRGGKVTTGRGKNYTSYSALSHQNPQAV